MVKVNRTKTAPASLAIEKEREPKIIENEMLFFS